MKGSGGRATAGAGEVDLAVIGGGPGGYVAAIRGAQLGMQTVLVEKEQLGGICLNWGCIPTKTLLRSAELLVQMRRAEAFGLTPVEPGFDLARIVDRSRDVAGRLRDGVTHLLKKNGVRVIRGHGRLEGNGKIRVNQDDGPGESLGARHIVLATGARARRLPALDGAGDRLWTYREAMVPDSLPESLLIVGAGAIGIEFASFFNSLGSRVTVVEALPRILPWADEDISQFVQREMSEQGVRFYTDCSVQSIQSDGKELSAELAQSDERLNVTAERVISAVGVVPNADGLGLEAAQVNLDKNGHVAVDEFCRSSAAGIYAIGDLAGAPCLAHKASHEAMICVEAIAGLPGIEPLDLARVPNCIYSSPQVASIGLTEVEAKERGYDVRIGRFPFAANGKAIALGETAGLVKTIFDRSTGELLGSHLAGTDVTELINIVGLAVAVEATDTELAQTVFAHPTLAEMLHESALDAAGHAIHI